MRAVQLPDPAAEAIRAHARETYPDECCGFLVVASEEDDTGPRKVLAAEPARNLSEGERSRRFVIRPDQLREVEGRLEGTGAMVGGFYHSHPDHPAAPSEFDRDHAWPWYSYLILGVTARSEGPLGAFELDPETGRFVAVPVSSAVAPDWPRGKRTPNTPVREEDR